MTVDGGRIPRALEPGCHEDERAGGVTVRPYRDRQNAGAATGTRSQRSADVGVGSRGIEAAPDRTEVDRR